MRDYLHKGGDFKSKLLKNASKLDSNLSWSDMNAIGVASPLGDSKFASINILEERYKNIVEKYKKDYSKPTPQEAVICLTKSIIDADIIQELKNIELGAKGSLSLLSYEAEGRAHIDMSMWTDFTISLAGSGLANFYFVHQEPFVKRFVDINQREKEGNSNFKDMEDLPWVSEAPSKLTLKLDPDKDTSAPRIITINGYQDHNARVNYATQAEMVKAKITVKYPGCKPNKYENIKFSEIRFNGLEHYLVSEREKAEEDIKLKSLQLSSSNELPAVEEITAKLFPKFSTKFGLIRSTVEIGNTICSFLGSLLDIRDLSGITDDINVDLEFNNPIITSVGKQEVEVIGDSAHADA